jgi:hypothetical protein
MAGQQTMEVRPTDTTGAFVLLQIPIGVGVCTFQDIVLLPFDRLLLSLVVGKPTNCLDLRKNNATTTFQ